MQSMLTELSRTQWEWVWDGQGTYLSAALTRYATCLKFATNLTTLIGLCNDRSIHHAGPQLIVDVIVTFHLVKPVIQNFMRPNRSISLWCVVFLYLLQLIQQINGRVIRSMSRLTAPLHQNSLPTLYGMAIYTIDASRVWKRSRICHTCEIHVWMLFVALGSSHVRETRGGCAR